MTSLKLWKAHSSWEEAEAAWEKQAKEAAAIRPIKGLEKLPQMVGITPETKRGLKWKSLKWMILEDKEGQIWGGVLKHPLKYGFAFIKSVFKKRSYSRDGDFFLYGLKSVQAFEEALKNPHNLFVVGFSYCEKPFECPSGRFTDQCRHDPQSLVCQQCFIGKAMHTLPEKNVFPLLIPTVHYIGAKIFDIVHSHPDKKVLFLITACEMTLEMFGDWGNMVGIQGIGVRLDGRICNTMKAFELSEKGIKPGLTVVLPATQQKILEFLRIRVEHAV